MRPILAEATGCVNHSCDRYAESWLGIASLDSPYFNTGQESNHSRYWRHIHSTELGGPQPPASYNASGGQPGRSQPC